MKFAEALTILQKAPPHAPYFRVVLACGFTPLHLSSYLGAYLQQSFVNRKVTVVAGEYGDLIGTVRRAASDSPDAVAIALEWTDLDPRLGYRQLGGWGPAQAQDSVQTARAALGRLADAVASLPAGSPVALSLPTLPFAPIFFTSPAQAGAIEIELLHLIHGFGLEFARGASHYLVNPQFLQEGSPEPARLDFKNELLAGLAYTIPHAEKVAAALARLLHPPASKKGLITDLDDTLWDGLVGEVGVDGIAWDLSGHQQIHGLYQQMLRALAESGVLVAVASKNEPDVIRQAFERKDILVSPDKIFPFEVHWHAKSGSVQRVLSAWNISADSVVFVDDSPLELAEVKAVHPGIECVRFPKDDYAGAHDFLWRLRDLFGKPRVGEEDSYRLNSLRQDSQRRAQSFSTNHSGSTDADSSDRFLASLEAVVEIEFGADAADARAFELVNKTNQFNLNGTRYTESEWRRQVDRPDAFLAVVSYRDKFGPLGKIAVVQGTRRDRALSVDTWVMSCRAFARRIEYQCLRLLFDRFTADQILLSYTPTLKNAPVREFLAALDCDLDRPSIQRPSFDGKCPGLFHRVEELRCITSRSE